MKGLLKRFHPCIPSCSAGGRCSGEGEGSDRVGRALENGEGLSAYEADWFELARATDCRQIEVYLTRDGCARSKSL